MSIISLILVCYHEIDMENSAIRTFSYTVLLLLSYLDSASPLSFSPAAQCYVPYICTRLPTHSFCCDQNEKHHYGCAGEEKPCMEGATVCLDLQEEEREVVVC